MNPEIYLKTLELSRDVCTLSSCISLVDAKVTALTDVVVANGIVKDTNMELITKLTVEAKFKNTIDEMKQAVDMINAEIERVREELEHEASNIEEDIMRSKKESVNPLDMVDDEDVESEDTESENIEIVEERL